MRSDQVIWKYEVKMEDTFVLELPEGAVVLTVQTQGDKPYIWARLNPVMPKTERRFAVYGTGHPNLAFNGRQDYIGTFQLMAFDLVFHLFELVQE